MLSRLARSNGEGWAVFNYSIARHRLRLSVSPADDLTVRAASGGGDSHAAGYTPLNF
ncbi:MAG: hypothetical protein KME17_13220 [Cyanosarcina radialis HA8281-LM2]|nr:hypothetical protein [Cyanosarcina radialis HA8281-LM2]